MYGVSSNSVHRTSCNWDLLPFNGRTFLVNWISDRDTATAMRMDIGNPIRVAVCDTNQNGTRLVALSRVVSPREFYSLLPLASE